MTGFSRQPQVIDVARRFLIGCRNREHRQLPTYGEVAAQYGGIARAAAQVLNSVRRDCDAAGEPDLSALVVDMVSGLPRASNGQPVVRGTASEAQWLDELRRIRAYPWR